MIRLEPIFSYKYKLFSPDGVNEMGQDEQKLFINTIKINLRIVPKHVCPRQEPDFRDCNYKRTWSIKNSRPGAGVCMCVTQGAVTCIPGRCGGGGGGGCGGGGSGMDRYMLQPSRPGHQPWLRHGEWCKHALL